MKTMAFYTSLWQMSRLFYYQLFVIVCIVFTVRVAVSMWGHSGEGKPPMLGDMEAQRHWMEVTLNLPVKDWYVNTPDNDLQYWGLDYPPLTAYHMMINGYVAHMVNPDMVALQSSQGIETKEAKIFMRSSVLLMDLLVFIPAVVFYFIFVKRKEDKETNVLMNIFILVAYPGLILIDNGHFQYNNISLGLLVLAILALSLQYDLVGAAVFCLSLNYKQMELYHATPFFFYLLGLCFKQSVSKGLYKLMTLGLIVVISFITIWSPFLTSKSTALAVVERIFPFNRGLYEDKVANVWCSISIIIKLKQMLSHSAMALICLSSTILALIPSSIHLLKHPTMTNFLYASVNSSLVFFLLSFHVHEKSILLAAIPVCLLEKSNPLAIVWFLLISVFSMFPLLIRDGQTIPTISLCAIFWMAAFHYLPVYKGIDSRLKIMFHSSILVAVCLGVAILTIPPPQRFPDIFPLLIAVYSCAHFVMFTIYFHAKQLQFDISIRVRNKKHDNDNTSSKIQQSEADEGPSRNNPRNLRKRKPNKVTFSGNDK